MTAQEKANAVELLMQRKGMTHAQAVKTVAIMCNERDVIGEPTGKPRRPSKAKRWD